MSELYQKPVLTNEVVDDFSADDFVFVQRDEKLVDKTYQATSYLKDVWSHFK